MQALNLLQLISSSLRNWRTRESARQGHWCWSVKPPIHTTSQSSGLKTACPSTGMTRKFRNFQVTYVISWSVNMLRPTWSKLGIPGIHNTVYSIVWDRSKWILRMHLIGFANNCVCTQEAYCINAPSLGRSLLFFFSLLWSKKFEADTCISIFKVKIPRIHI